MTLPRRALAAIVAVLLVGSAAAGAALAQDQANETEEADEDEMDRSDEEEREESGDSEAEDDDDDEREDAFEERREVKASSSGSTALFELKRESATSEDEIKLEYQAQEGDLKLEFKREANATESEMEYKVDLERVVEYEDANDNGVYDEETENVSSAYAVDEDMNWTVGPVEDVTAANRTGKTITATGTLGDANGTMRVVLYAYGDFAEVNGSQLRPTEVKIDFAWSNYPWQGNDTRLALDLETEATTESEVEEAGNAVNATAGDVSAYFEWADVATVDGETTSVESQVLESESSSETESDEDGTESETSLERELQLNYAQGDEIVHDPVMGVQSADTGTANGAPGPGLAAVVAASLVAGFAARSVRRR
jgi:hypothetical protein